MSHSSLSPTPTRNLSDSNITRYPHLSTTSRPHSLEQTPSERLARDYTEPLTLRLSPPPPPSEAPRAESSTARLRRRRSSPESPPPDEEEPMAKRIRRAASIDHRPVAAAVAAAAAIAARPDSSPSSDSQDDMADNEMELGKAHHHHHHPEPMAPASLPPKKKRTRTLTTPHQSAVLHALLAQSRFPTTAMREEVGRSIGLSARKVQIWFQNQRQKARRPRSTSDAPPSHHRPPQYGPFPSVPEPVSHGHRGFDEHGIDRMYYARHPSPEPPHPVSVSAEVPVRLLGPGMPGAPLFAPQSYRQVRPPPPSSSPPAPDPRYQSHGGVGAPPPPTSFLPRVMSPEPYRSPPMYTLPGVRPATSQPSSWRERERDPSRTLPPLEATRPSSSSYGARRLPSTSTSTAVAPAAYPLSRQAPYAPPPPPRSISPEARFAHLPPPEPAAAAAVAPLRHTGTLTLTLPPPFTLQPSPQWDEASYAPRPSSSAWSRPGSRSTRGRRSTSPVAVRREREREHLGLGGPTIPDSRRSPDAYYLAEHSTGTAVPAHSHSSSPPRSIPPVSVSVTTTPPPSRSGRYDPVRATYVPFSSTTPSGSPAVSPAGAAATATAAVDEQRAEGIRKPSPVHEDR